MGNGMHGTRGMGECYFQGNVAKYSAECRKTFRGMSSNIPWNVAKHSGEHSSNILHAVNSQIQHILAYISILFQK